MFLPPGTITCSVLKTICSGTYAVFFFCIHLHALLIYMYLKEYSCEDLGGGDGELLFSGYKVSVLKGEYFF